MTVYAGKNKEMKLIFSSSVALKFLLIFYIGNFSLGITVRMPLLHTTVHNDDVEYNEQKAILKLNSGILFSSLFVCLFRLSLSLTLHLFWWPRSVVFVLFFFTVVNTPSKHTTYVYRCAARVSERGKKALTKTLLLLLLRFFVLNIQYRF